MGQRFNVLQELDVLSHAATLSPAERERPHAQPPPPPEVLEQLRSAAAAMNSAEQMRATVFRPSHILPTVTLPEQVPYFIPLLPLVLELL
jgi:hypothetical protein